MNNNRTQTLHKLAEQVRTTAAALETAKIESLKHHKATVHALLALGEPLHQAQQQLTRQEFGIWVRNSLPLPPPMVTSTLRAFPLRKRVASSRLDGDDLTRLLRCAGVIPPRRGKVSIV